jgi:hypothetical protein
MVIVAVFPLSGFWWIRSWSVSGLILLYSPEDPAAGGSFHAAFGSKR